MIRIKLNIKSMKEIITLPEPDEMVKIWSHISENGFIFDEFLIAAEPIKTTFRVKIEGRGQDQIFHIKLTTNIGLNLKTTYIDTNIDEILSNYAELMNNVYTKGYTKETLDNQAADLIIPFHFMQYVIYSNMHRTIEYIEAAERSSDLKPHKTRNKNIQEYSLTDCIKIYHHKNKNRKKYEYTCPAWPVRGFFRHNHNGTISYVRPYPKGKDREKLKNTNYKI